MVGVAERFGLIPAAGFRIAEVEGGLSLTRHSIFSRRDNTMVLPITAEQFRRWRIDGEMIQDVMPELTPDQREFLMTGATPEEWAEEFPPNEEED